MLTTVPTHARRLRAGVLLATPLLLLLLAPPPPTAAAPAVGAVVQAQDTLVQLAAEATRAVVRIDVETAATSRQGSGFLVDGSGRILTNHHVIRDAQSLEVRLASGDVYDVVQILATDERRDMAVLQVAGFDLPSLPLGNSDSVRVGNPVVLIGSPLGLENTVTTGIVSGRRQEDEGYQVLQISAPASVGSSGGPVLSRTGQVVAIASSQMPSGQNLNFALPINYARGLLANMDGVPVAVLRPTPSVGDPTRVPLSTAGNAVNRGLFFDLSEFGGYSAEMEVRVGEDLWRRTRITYRVIETVGGGEPRVERYLEGETTRNSGPFGTPQTIRRERVRTLVHVDGLRPISTRGETARWTGEAWEQASYDLRFEGYRVRGLIRDEDGRVEEIERELPPGIVLREVRHLAFGTLAVDSLVGRSVELATFDGPTGDVTTDRYDVRAVERLEVGGEVYEALRINVASGLSNTDAFFRATRPRILLRQRHPGDGGVEEVTSLELFGPHPGG